MTNPDQCRYEGSGIDRGCNEAEAGAGDGADQVHPKQDSRSRRSRFERLMRRDGSRRAGRSRDRHCRPSRPRRRRAPSTGSLPVRAAASATAAPGSTTSLNSRKAVSMASSTSSSVTTSPGPKQLLSEREGDVARRRSQQRVADRAESLSFFCLVPLASDRARSSKPAGSPA